MKWELKHRAMWSNNHPVKMSCLHTLRIQNIPFANACVAKLNRRGHKNCFLLSQTRLVMNQVHTPQVKVKVKKIYFYSYAVQVAESGNCNFYISSLFAEYYKLSIAHQFRPGSWSALPRSQNRSHSKFIDIMFRDRPFTPGFPFNLLGLELFFFKF